MPTLAVFQLYRGIIIIILKFLFANKHAKIQKQTRLIATGGASHNQAILQVMINLPVQR
jgi:spore coat polysaccharide biosynthesis predicted glycosyltransferase SpsG